MAWPPSPSATHIEVVESDASPRSVLVEHFNEPFERIVSNDNDGSLQQAAYEYLEQLCAQPFIANALQLPQHWRDAMNPGNAPHFLFGWVPFDDPQPAIHQAVSGPRGSFRSKPGWDEVAVLYASDRLGKDDYLGSGFGLALATRVRDDGGTLKAGFVGVSAALPYGQWAELPALPLVGILSTTFNFNYLFRSSAALATIARAATLSEVAIHGVRIAASPTSQWWIERRGAGIRRISGVDVPHAVTMLTTGSDTTPSTDTITHVAPMIADADGDAPVIDRDPSSATGKLVRPTRDDLQAFRSTEKIMTGAAGALEHPPGAPTPLIQVMRCPRFVKTDGPLQPQGVRAVNLPDTTPVPPPAPTPTPPPVISNDASAIQAFRHGRELVERLRAYGWTPPEKYFRITAPEIRIYYRSGISPGPGKDGQSVNARVIPDGWPASAIAWAGTRPAVHIHLSGGDLRVRARERWTPGGAASAAIPLGIGIDKRWMWHEFGHVLLVASTGELEFRFAHSPGDALAAIASDPDSLLQDRRRGLTFPFVYLPRQHDRCAAHGWSWTGSMHQALAAVPDALQPRPKGYASEQILSSSLFRLYRCIGGDTQDLAAPPTYEDRKRASHYTLYLIMQAMQLMGDARIQATATPAKFVHWLRQADRSKGTWSVAWGAPGAPPFQRVGGTAGKVIRWAFEAQGLYGSGNGPGSPEPVDIYIESDRPACDKPMYGDTDYGPGAYVPVSLDWQGTQGALPAWHANPVRGITFKPAAGTVEVRVGNRGPHDANNVGVSLWIAPWQNPAPPDWSATSGEWTCCPITGLANQHITGRTGGTLFTFALPSSPAPATGRHILFAQAGCPADRANTDPTLLLACASGPTPLVDLVANDNNLGLLVITI